MLNGAESSNSVMCFWITEARSIERAFFVLSFGSVGKVGVTRPSEALP